MFSEFDWLKLTAESPAMMTLIAFSIVTFGVAIERTLGVVECRLAIDLCVIGPTLRDAQDVPLCEPRIGRS